MPWRTYTINQKYTKVDGTVRIYKVKNKKWINSNQRYKPQKRGLEKKSIYSSRFGFLELYNRKEQQSLICPSGYSISQCFNAMRKLWFAYHKSMNYDKDLQKVKKYAMAIQKVQQDMGIPTTSFPHLGIYGDLFVLNDKQGNRVVFEDHSAMKRLQQHEKWQAENSRKIQQLLSRPDQSKGETLEVLVDDVYPFEKVEYETTVPQLQEPNEERGEHLLTITDEIPFLDQNSSTKIQKKNLDRRIWFTESRLFY